MTTYTFDSSITDLDDAIIRIVGHVPLRPNIDYYSAPSLEWLGAMTAEEQAPYTKLYEELIEPYFWFAGTEPTDLFHETYGFNPQKIKHHLLNDLMLDAQRFHYKFMKPIVAQVERDVRLTEIQQGWKYADDDRWFLIREKSLDVRRTQIQDQWERFHPMPEPVDYTEYNHIMERAGNTEPVNLTEMVSDFNKNHPFWAGWFGMKVLRKAGNLLSD